MRTPQRIPGSFRDPAGHVLLGERAVFRSLTPTAYQTLEPFLASEAHRSLVDAGLLIASDQPEPAELAELLLADAVGDRNYLRHPRVSFLSFPSEWSHGMLADAAICTLDVQSTLLREGYTLKDASAYNILFEFGPTGPAPVFIDVPSVQPFDGGHWVALRQFVSHFLLPLALDRSLAWRTGEIFLGHTDGVDLDVAYQRIGLLRRYMPPYFLFVTVPRLLARWERNLSEANAARRQSGEAAIAAAQRWVDVLRRQISRLRTERKSAVWDRYLEDSPYPAEARNQKRAFVESACANHRFRQVLDVGCHMGEYSFLAAEAGATVVAVDSDPALIDSLYRRARVQGTPILPLCVDMANPTPALGWNNAERPSFLERIEGCDCVFALAVTHHLMIRNRIPLPQVVDFFHRLTDRFLVLELVDYTDAMFKNLAFGNESLYEGFTIKVQEQAFLGRFSKISEQNFEGVARAIYLLEKRQP